MAHGITLSSGRRIPNEIYGLGPDLELAAGYDYFVSSTDENGDTTEGAWGDDEEYHPFTAEERREIAALIIERWRRWADA